MKNLLKLNNKNDEEENGEINEGSKRRIILDFKKNQTFNNSNNNE